jgi:hypothetical protein
MAGKKFTENSKDAELFIEVIKNLIDNGVDVEKIQNQLKSLEFHAHFYKTAGEVASKYIYNTMMKNSRKNLELTRMQNREFEDRLNFLWREPFEQFETLIYVSQEIGDEFNQEFRPDAAKENDLVFEILIRLHGRACQTALEILVLMQKGFPEGAIARWRTLHEIVITSYFIQEIGQNAAERYYFHDAIQSWKSIKEYVIDHELYEKHKQALSEPLLSMREMKKIVKIKEKLCEKYKKGYDGDYGWAADIIPNPNPANLAKYTKFDHLNPYYRMANISIHGGSKGIKYFLSSPNNDFIPAGPGNMGMSTPGQLAAVSLLQINTCLLTTRPCIKQFADISTLKKLVRKVQRSFAKVDKESMKIYRKLHEKND